MTDKSVQYLYNTNDQRIYKQIYSLDKEYYLYDAMGRMIALKVEDEITASSGLKWKYYVSGAERELSIIPNALQQPGSNSVNTSSVIGLTQAEYYLYDHLGNTRISFMPISKAVGQPLQVRVNNAIDYYPYGKVLREYRYGDESRYMTTQHERDQETGLDYRGARYYDSELGRFNSVDPLASQYTGWSTYNYVMGNPVMLVDPTGRGPENNIRISKNGNVEVEKTKDNFDMIYIEGDKEPIKLDKGQLQYTWEYKKDSKGRNVNYEVLQFSSNTLAERIFERIANQSTVEWSFIATKRGSSQAGFLTSSAGESTDGASSALYSRKLYKENYTIIADSHSHPGNDSRPSGDGINPNGFEDDGKWGDRGHARAINEYYASKNDFHYIVFRIYVQKSRSYVEYNEDGRIK